MRKVLVAVLATCGFSVSAQTNVSVDWEWKREHRCSSTSPALKLTGIPAGTKNIRVKLIDNDMTSFNHGGGDVPFAGNDAFTIEAGSLKNYTGPCPPNFSSFGHDYTFSVTAVGADGTTILGTGTATKNFSAKNVPQ